MKIRQGFVSNSSSSSFVIAQCALTEEQIEKLVNYQSRRTHDGKYGADSNFGDCYYGDSWDIHRNDIAKIVTGFTLMDNGDMTRFMREECNIDTRQVHFEGD